MCKEGKIVSKRYFLVMGYIAVEFRVSMHRVLILNLLLRYKDEGDVFVYFLLTSAQNYTYTVTTLRTGWDGWQSLTLKRLLHILGSESFSWKGPLEAF